MKYVITRKYSLFVRTIAILLILVFITPVCANATDTQTTTRASYYLDSYNAYPYNAALGKIRIYFHVTGVDYMDEIGTLNVKIYESTDNTNWSWIKTYTHDKTTGMLGYDKIYHSGYVEYSGTIGRYYKAYVCIWAGTEGTGDTRYMWTQPQKATLFAG